MTRFAAGTVRMELPLVSRVAEQKKTSICEFVRASHKLMSCFSWTDNFWLRMQSVVNCVSSLTCGTHCLVFFVQ